MNIQYISYLNILKANIFKNLNGGSKENTDTKREKMFKDDQEQELYTKYMAFNNVMLEDYEPIEIAAIMVVQALSLYRTVMNDEDYQKITKSIYDKRNSVHTFE